MDPLDAIADIEDRFYELRIARKSAFQQARDKGYTLRDIAQAGGYASHTTVRHILDTPANTLPAEDARRRRKERNQHDNQGDNSGESNG